MLSIQSAQAITLPSRYGGRQTTQWFLWKSRQGAPNNYIHLLFVLGEDLSSRQ